MLSLCQLIALFFHEDTFLFSSELMGNCINATVHRTEKPKMLFPTLLCAFMAVNSCYADPNIPEHEMQALQDLYEATDGDHWHWSTHNPLDILPVGIPWNFSDPKINNPCKNQWQGINCSFPAPYDTYFVTVIALPLHNMVGTIPDSIGSIQKLQSLFLPANQLSGSIPESLCGLPNLQSLVLQDNNLRGPIPSSMSNLLALVRLTLCNNQLTSTIPISLGLLTGIEIIELCSNRLTGSLPNIFGSMSRLNVLDVSDNNLNGTLPNSLDSLLQLDQLYLYINAFSGSLPDDLCDLNDLQYLILYDNALTGTVPPCIGELSQLQFLYLSENALTGPIPVTIGDLQQLLFLNVDFNALSGPVPQSIGTLPRLQGLSLSYNKLTGTLPESLGALAQLRVLGCYVNQLSGTVPASLGNLSHLNYLEVTDNRLTGSLPQSLGALSNLVYLYAENNYLAGAIPPTVDRLIALQELHLSHNYFSCPIPSLASLLHLQVVLLQNNKHFGSLDGVFNPAVQPRVQAIVLNDNQLTGQLPDEIFQLKLNTFVAASNCFQGTIPADAICENQEMVSLVLDGMSSASSCRNKLFVGAAFSAYSLQHQVGGTIPTCLLQLPNLTTLHLSGNGITGSIPSDVKISPTLTDLALSHNVLTGAIPDVIQKKRWTNIDLSFNRFSGTLRTDFAPNGSIELLNNRLSGRIPASFKNLVNVSVLGSNTFSCSVEQTDLPRHDPNREQYHCGSRSFEIYYYVWLGLMAAVFVALIYLRRTCADVTAVLTWETVRTELRYSELLLTLSTACRIAVTCCVYIVVILLPVYCVASIHHGTQTYEYAYQISAAYQTGAVPFALNMTFWLVLLLIVVPMFVRALQPAHDSRAELGSAHVIAVQAPARVWFVYVSYIAVDGLVVIGANAAYVYVAVYKSNTLLLVVQTLLSLFKVAWASRCLPYLLRQLIVYAGAERTQFTSLQMIVTLVNTIVIPCLVVAIVNPDCFYNAFIAAPAVTSSVSYQSCATIEYGVDCVLYKTSPLYTTYEPPFVYNYQCSSSMVTYYAPAFVSMCIVNTVVVPAAQYTALWLYGRAAEGSRWREFLSCLRPQLFRAVSSDRREGDSVTKRLNAVITALGLLLTFGVVFPPLGVALTVTVVALVYLFRVEVNAVLTSGNDLQKVRAAEYVSTQCNSSGSAKVLLDAFWMLMTLSCWFYTLFLFDTLGDAVGFDGAYWVLIVMPLMPALLYGLYFVCDVYVLRLLPGNNVILAHQRKHGGDVELAEGPRGQTRSSYDNGGADNSAACTEVHNVLVCVAEARQHA